MGIFFWSLVFGHRSSVFCFRSSVLVISRRSSVIGRRSSVVGLRYYHCTIYKIFGLRKSLVTWSSVHPYFEIIFMQKYTLHCCCTYTKFSSFCLVIFTFSWIFPSCLWRSFLRNTLCQKLHRAKRKKY